MKQAAKINLDNVVAEEQDKQWARDFLYPDLRKPYRLFYNEQGYVHALDLVAKARAAWRIEQAEKTSTAYKRTTVNGKPATPEQEKEIDDVFKEFDGIFKSVNKMFDKISKRIRRI